MEQEHKRRPRYKGTHPRTFQEKYKEHDPENYRSDVEKIIESGKTPAGDAHPHSGRRDPGGRFRSSRARPATTPRWATAATRRMLAQLQGQGHLYATDVDPIEMERPAPGWHLRASGRSSSPSSIGISPTWTRWPPACSFDFVLADLGVSSMQIDDPARGFTFKQDGPLDLRLDPSSGVTAAERLRQLDQEELENPAGGKFRRALRGPHRKGRHSGVPPGRHCGIPPASCTPLIEGRCLSSPPGERKEAVKKSCQRTFQALRIDVNSEFEVLYAFLEKLPHVLKPGGRAAILTFHSGEDRLVKQAFRQQYRDGLYSDIAQEVTRPLSPQECRRNPGPLHQAALGCPGGVNADFMEKELTSMLRDETIRRVIQFRDDREWRQFHTPKDLAISLSLEAAELLEIFQWSGADLECRDKLGRIREELADVLSYCVLMADVCGLDLDEILNAKVDQNAAKYPVEKARGSAAKYTELT